MNWKKELNFFALVQREYKSDYHKNISTEKIDYVLEFSDEFDSKGNLLFFPLSISDKIIKEFYNKLIVIVFVDESDYKSYSRIINKAYGSFMRGNRGGTVFPTSLYYAHYPIELYEIYKKNKYSKPSEFNEVFKFSCNTYKDFCFTVYDEVVNNKTFEKSKLRLEYNNYQSCNIKIEDMEYRIDCINNKKKWEFLRERFFQLWNNGNNGKTQNKLLNI